MLPHQNPFKQMLTYEILAGNTGESISPTMLLSSMAHLSLNHTSHLHSCYSWHYPDCIYLHVYISPLPTHCPTPIPSFYLISAPSLNPFPALIPSLIMAWVLHLLPVLAMHSNLSLHVTSSLVPHPVMCPLLYPCINPHPAPVPTPHPVVTGYSHVVPCMHVFLVSIFFFYMTVSMSPCLPLCHCFTSTLLSIRYPQKCQICFKK